MQVTSSPGIYRTIYNNGCYLQLFGKGYNDKVFKFLMKSSFFEISALLF